MDTIVIPLKYALKPYEDPIIQWINNNEICNNNEKKKDLLWDIIKCIYNSGIEITDFKEIISICKAQNIEIIEGDLWEYLKKYFKETHIKFLKCISNICPRGLSTSPNADCGKYELLCRMLRPNSRQPNKGDNIEDGIIKEIKGSQVRLNGDVNGEDYIKKTNKIFEGSGIIGNKPKTGKLKDTYQYEIEKSQYLNHYSEQFCKDISKSKDLIKKYLDIHDIDYLEEDIENMFKDNVWNQNTLKNLWLKKMFPITKGEANMMIIFGDGKNVKILKTEDDLKKIKISTDYFRINQSVPVGFYIE